MKRLCLLGFALLLATACSNDGRTLRSPAPGASVPPTPSTAKVDAGSKVGSNDNGVIQTVSSAPSGLALTSTAFANGNAIPAAYTCDAPDAVSPPLVWSGLPAGTVELALTVVDPDAGNFVHWFIAGMTPAVRGVEQGVAPEGAIELQNGAGATGWTPPCPPAGAKAHRYLFTIYALGQPSGITPSTPTSDALAVLTANAIGTSTLAAIYKRA